MSNKPLHHHGNLRPALIEAGIEILEQDGLEALTLRRVAAKTGVSHAAPAHHFDGKNGLLVAIAARGFETFTGYMERARAAADPAPKSQLAAICEGYLEFSERHHAQFQLIFSPPIKQHSDETLKKSSMAAFNLLVEVCDLFEPLPSHPRANAIMIWSLVHGFATLRVYSGLMRRDDGSEMPVMDILPDMVPRTS